MKVSAKRAQKENMSKTRLFESRALFLAKVIPACLLCYRGHKSETGLLSKFSIEKIILDLKAQGKLRNSNFFGQKKVFLVMEQLENNL